jgi:hypothetical protein
LGRLQLEASSGRKLGRPHLNLKKKKKKLDVVACTCHPSYVGTLSKRISTRQKKKTLPKKNKAERTVSIVQMAQHLPNKHEVLSSKSQYCKKKS